MKSVFMIRVYGHKVDSEGRRDNQLVAPAYASKKLAQSAIERQESRCPGLFHHSEVEEVTVLEG